MEYIIALLAGVIAALGLGVKFGRNRQNREVAKRREAFREEAKRAAETALKIEKEWEAKQQKAQTKLEKQVNDLHKESKERAERSRLVDTLNRYNSEGGEG